MLTFTIFLLGLQLVIFLHYLTPFITFYERLFLAVDIIKYNYVGWGHKQSFKYNVKISPSCWLVLMMTLPFDGLWGRGELTTLFTPLGCLVLWLEWNLFSHNSFESEFHFFNPLNTLNKSAVVTVTHHWQT